MADAARAAVRRPSRRLLFDGNCGFCSSLARWADRRLPADATTEPWQRADLETLGLTRDEVADHAYWVDADGRKLRGHEAAAAALRAIGGPLGLAGVVMLVPPVSWASMIGYELVSRIRHRLPGGTPACAGGR
jgi:predicted DCC family thiol-disulfide oxidoreductase YuxK